MNLQVLKALHEAHYPHSTAFECVASEAQVKEVVVRTVRIRQKAYKVCDPHGTIFISTHGYMQLNGVEV